MRSAVEFHDSTVSAVRIEGTFVRISIDAYVHRWDRVDGRWKGTGWMQPIQIVLANASNEGQPECPVDLAGGEVRAGQIRHKNLVPLPFDSSGPATLRLELATGKVLDFNGRSLVIEPTGEGRYVEDLRDDFRPSDAGGR
jgi:hypothetical protein